MSRLIVTGVTTPDVSGTYLPTEQEGIWIREDAAYRIWHNVSFSRYDITTADDLNTPFSRDSADVAGAYSPWGGSPGTGTPVVEEITAAVTLEATLTGNVATGVMTTEGGAATEKGIQWIAMTPFRAVDSENTASWTYTAPGTYAVRASAKIGGSTYYSETIEFTISNSDIPAEPSGGGGESTMPFAHGVTIEEVATSLLSPVATIGSLPVVIGECPVWQVDGGNGDAVNTPILITSWAEALSLLGYSSDWAKYPACEAMDVFFRLYNVGPVVFINPLDPVADGTAGTTTASLVAGVYTLNVADVVLDTLTVKSADGNTLYVLDQDYTVAYNDDWKPVITRKGTGISSATASLKYEYKTVVGDEMEAADIVTGIGAVEQVYSKTGQVPMQLLAPGWSDNATVAAALVAACSVNGVFQARAITDVPTGTCDLYSEVSAWKSTNSYTDKNQVVCWPMVELGGVIYHLSTHYAAVRMQRTYADSDIPYASPSNQRLSADGACLADGTAVWLSNVQANLLNAAGVVTALNWSRGWVVWGNESGAYPASTDPKDRFNCIRDMWAWIGNTAVVTYWQKIDSPGNPRQIDTIVNTLNQWLNSLAAGGYILGGTCRFEVADNPTVNLIGGSFVFIVDPTPPTPIAGLTFRLEYNTSYLDALFG